MGSIKFRWNPAGYRELKNSGKVQALITSKAYDVKAAATASLSTGGYRAINDFETHDVTISKDATKAKIVATHSLHATRSQNKRKTLTKALGNASKG